MCGKPADSEDRLICQKCWTKIQSLEAPYCSVCRQLLYESTQCPDCRSKSMLVFSLGAYEGHLQTVLHDLKFKYLRPLAKMLGQKLADLIAPRIHILVIDLILPVPLHDTRHYQRGFNQSEEIGRAIGEVLNIPLDNDILYVTRKTKQQARLPAHRREANIRGAFDVDDRTGQLRDKTILLVDDVTTTGATLRENERILLNASARKIIAAVAATAL